MSFNIDTGGGAPFVKSSAIDPSQRVRFTNRERADRTRRQIIAAFEECETLAEFDAYCDAEQPLMEAVSQFDFGMAQELRDAITERRAVLKYGTTPSPAEPGSRIAQLPERHDGTKGTAMFKMDTGSTGSEGPWIAWSARGTLDGIIPQRSFYLRNDAGKEVLPQFAQGVVMDIHNMKTGWQRSEGVAGKAPEWKWGASIDQLPAQPGDEWKKGLSIRCAIGRDKVATWEQAGAAVWNGFCDLIPALSAGPGDGSLPVIRMTGARVEQYARGSTTVPVLEVVKWVARPDCLKQSFAMAPAPAAPPPRPQPAANPQPAPFANRQAAPAGDIEDEIAW